MGLIFRNDRAKDIKYYVNEEKRTVTAVMTNCSRTALSLISKLSNNQGGELFVDTRASKALEMPYKIVATARCAEEDVFDLNFGKQLAKKRVINKFRIQTRKALTRYLNLLEKREEVAKRALEKYRQN